VVQEGVRQEGLRQERVMQDANGEYGLDEDANVDNAARLCALGFPPALVRRALLAYPHDLNRAADWILQADEW